MAAVLCGMVIPPPPWLCSACSVEKKINNIYICILVYGRTAETAANWTTSRDRYLYGRRQQPAQASKSTADASKRQIPVGLSNHVQPLPTYPTVDWPIRICILGSIHDVFCGAYLSPRTPSTWNSARLVRARFFYLLCLFVSCLSTARVKSSDLVLTKTIYIYICIYIFFSVILSICVGVTTTNSSRWRDLPISEIPDSD